MSRAEPRITRLEDYTPPPFLIDTVDLLFELDEVHTTVRSRLAVRRNPDVAQTPGNLRLDGVGLELIDIALDGEPLEEGRWSAAPGHLTVSDVPPTCIVETTSRVCPRDNTSLEGLYLSGQTLCTQCEAEGFRKITWFLDRPDVMSRYRVAIVADRGRYPVVLSNGNRLESTDIGRGRHRVRWEDPFPKPSYLFAMVAGDLACLEEGFTTASGRDVRLQIFAEHHNWDRCGHAMESLKKAMRWDEETYGLEYDLDSYMVVAVDDFNMGAMENKGLNVFNSKYVLARPETATDSDYAAIEGIIAHEYFHNWTGNRVTCRDWFQLSLKEGLTVFRDQEFSADVTQPALKRIQDVRLLRTHQFAEDSGPMAHPVRPDSYLEISNFYTVTIYNKGAEVVRMVHNLLGPEAFRRGMDLYFERHDGQAVTIEDFVRAMEDAGGVELGQFRLWYSQAGTPLVEAAGEHRPAERRFELRLRQHTPATPGQPAKQPLHIPIRIGLLGPRGDELALRLAGEPSPGPGTRVLELTGAEQGFVFEDVAEAPVASIGRGFSAPVRFQVRRSAAELTFLMTHDQDPFTRWDAGQEYALDLAHALMEAQSRGASPALPPEFVAAYARTLEDPSLDKGLVAETLGLPSETYIAETMEVIDVDAIHEVRRRLRRELARALEAPLLRVYDAHRSNEPYAFDPASAARRSLKNACLGYLLELDTTQYRELAVAQIGGADNMTDTLAALTALAGCDCPERGEALEAFHDRWRDDDLVIDKWFTLQALSPLPGTLAEVRGLLEHPAFDLRRPNKVRALLGAFCHGNQVRFHGADGEGYRFLADQVLALDPLNAQVAARLVGAFARWRRFDDGRRAQMRNELERILAAPALSRDVYEIARKTAGA